MLFINMFIAILNTLLNTPERTAWNLLSFQQVQELGHVRVPCPPPRQSNPNIVFMETAFGFVISMESLIEFYDQHCSKTTWN